MLGGSGGPGQHCVAASVTPSSYLPLFLSTLAVAKNQLKPDYSLCQPPIDTKFEASTCPEGE